jgi:AcrR family transcriptional regulator
MSGGEDTPGRGKALAVVRAGVVERLRARRSEIEEAIFARINDDMFDPAGSGDAEYVAGLRATVAAVVDYGFTGIEQGEGSSVAVPSAAVAQARRAARVGVGLDTVLRRYVAGHALLEDFVMQEADHEDFAARGIALRGVLRTSSSLLDRLIASITSAYMRELEQAGHSSTGSVSSAVNDGGPVLSPGRGPRSQRARISRRDRILQAMVEVVAERGFAGATVKRVTARAGVSSRAFYESFEGLEDCLAAVFDLGRERTVELILEAFEGEETWQGGVRKALASLLVFLDSEPLFTRVWLVESLGAGAWAHEHRERNLRALRELVLASWPASEDWSSPPLAAEGAIASVLGIVHAHIVTGKPEPLIELLGPLMGLVAAPYLDARSVEREIERGDELAREIREGERTLGAGGEQPRGLLHTPGDLAVGSGVSGIAAMMENPRAHRAWECLVFVAEHPGASNREVAAGIGVGHQSQVSKLLGFLAREGLAVKRSEGAGKRNEWRLTPRGEEISRVLTQQQ